MKFNDSVHRLVFQRRLVEAVDRLVVQQIFVMEQKLKVFHWFSFYSSSFVIWHFSFRSIKFECRCFLTLIKFLHHVSTWISSWKFWRQKRHLVEKDEKNSFSKKKRPREEKPVEDRSASRRVSLSFRLIKTKKWIGFWIQFSKTNRQNPNLFLSNLKYHKVRFIASASCFSSVYSTTNKCQYQLEWKSVR